MPRHADRAEAGAVVTRRYFSATDQQVADTIAAMVECAACGAVYHKASRHACPARQRYCGPCDRYVPARETVCKECGADTDMVPR